VTHIVLSVVELKFNTRYHGVELGQVSCGKQTFECGI